MTVAKKSSKAAQKKTVAAFKKKEKVTPAEEKRAAMKAELKKKAEAEAVLAASKKAAKKAKKPTAAAGDVLVKDEDERAAMADLGIHSVFRDSRNGMEAVIFFNADPEAKKGEEIAFESAQSKAALSLIKGIYAAIREAVDARYAPKKTKK